MHCVAIVLACVLLQRNHTLEDLDIQNNDIEDDGAGLLADALIVRSFSFSLPRFTSPLADSFSAAGGRSVLCSVLLLFAVLIFTCLLCSLFFLCRLVWAGQLLHHDTQFG